MHIPIPFCSFYCALGYIALWICTTSRLWRPPSTDQIIIHLGNYHVLLGMPDLITPKNAIPYVYERNFDCVPTACNTLKSASSRNSQVLQDVSILREFSLLAPPSQPHYPPSWDHVHTTHPRADILHSPRLRNQYAYRPEIALLCGGGLAACLSDFDAGMGILEFWRCSVQNLVFSCLVFLWKTFISGSLSLFLSSS